MLNPCCCVTPRIGAFIFAILDLILSITNGLWVLTNVGDRFENWVEFAFAILLILLAILLLVGAIQNSIEKLKLWLILWIVLLLCVFLFQVFNMYSAKSSMDRSRIGSSFGAFLLFIYEIWVVYAFIHELRYGPAGLTYCPSQIV